MNEKAACHFCFLTVWARAVITMPCLSQCDTCGFLEEEGIVSLCFPCLWDPGTVSSVTLAYGRVLRPEACAFTTHRCNYLFIFLSSRSSEKCKEKNANMTTVTLRMAHGMLSLSVCACVTAFAPDSSEVALRTADGLR